MRTVTNLRLTGSSQKDDYRFSMTFAADLETKESIRTEFMKLLEKASKKIDPAPCDAVFQMSFDLFEWG
jgi:hypothetical protein